LDLSSAGALAVAVSRPAAAPAAAPLRELLARSAEGDTDSFERVYDLTVKRVYGLVLRRLCDRADAERVTQHVYVTLWRQAGALLAKDCHPLAGIISLAHHEVVQYRSRTGPGATAERADLGEVVQRSTMALSRTQQEILTLVYLGGYTPRQVAELLQLERVTVSTALSTGLRRLTPDVTVPS
jgi:RNA polymerase sigma-70 factor, ECF subfamily